MRCLRVVVLLLALGSGLRLGADEKAERLHALMRRNVRPHVRELLSLSAVLGPLGEATTSEQFVFQVYADTLARLRRRYPGAHKVIFGRDCEFLYDAAVTSAAPEEAKLWHLAPISREVAEHSSAEALEQLFTAFGVDVTAVAEGRATMVWLDTGARGTLYLDLLAKLIGRRRSVEEQITLAGGIEALLLQSRGSGGWEPHRRWLGARRRGEAEIRTYAESNLYFDELDAEALDLLGVPRGFRARSHWLVDHIEHAPKWHYRGLRYDVDGTMHYEGRTRFTGYLDRAAHLELQRKVLRHFQRPCAELFSQ